MALSKLLQKPHVPIEEQLNVIHALLQNRDAVHAHAEGEAGDLFRIVTHKAEHIRVHHAAAQQFDPAALLAVPAARSLPFAAAEDTAEQHLGAGLGKGEKRRTEARPHARSEQRLHGMVQRSLQIAKVMLVSTARPSN